MTQDELIARARASREKNFGSMSVSDATPELFAGELLGLLQRSELILAHRPTILQEFGAKFKEWADERDALLDYIDELRSIIKSFREDAMEADPVLKKVWNRFHSLYLGTDPGMWQAIEEGADNV